MERDNLKNGFINIITESDHKKTLTLSKARKYTENFSKPALLKGMVNIPPEMATREFFDQVPPDKKVQWRVKEGNQAVSMRAEDGSSDYNYVTGRVGTGKEFLDNIFSEKLDVYSHLGTISSGYNDPYEWGKEAFRLVKDEIFSQTWFDVPEWEVTGHFFSGEAIKITGSHLMVP